MSRSFRHAFVSTLRGAFRCAACVTLTLCLAGGAAANDVLAGYDLFSTPPGGAVNDFGNTNPTVPGDVPPIPPDFFFPGSLPFFGVVEFVGNPPGTFLGQPTGPADTIVERLSDAALPTIPSSDVLPIQIVELQLVSVAPIQVDPGPTFWEVQVQLEPLPSVGSMTITHDTPDGGTYDASIDVCPRLTFFELAPPFRIQQLDYCLQVDPAGQNVSVAGQPWVHHAVLPLVSPLSGPNFFVVGPTFHTGPHPQANPIETPLLPPGIPSVGPGGLVLMALLLLLMAGLVSSRLRRARASLG